MTVLCFQHMGQLVFRDEHESPIEQFVFVCERLQQVLYGEDALDLLTAAADAPTRWHAVG